MSIELKSLKPAETFTVEVIQPDSGDTFTAVLASPFTAEGEQAVDDVIAALKTVKGDAAKTRATILSFVARVLRALPDVTVDGAPLVLRDAAHAESVLTDLPYLVSQLDVAYMERVRFLDARRTRSSSTSDTSADSTAP